jgi:hypothetical protein
MLDLKGQMTLGGGRSVVERLPVKEPQNLAFHSVTGAFFEQSLLGLSFGPACSSPQLTIGIDPEGDHSIRDRGRNLAICEAFSWHFESAASRAICSSRYSSTPT